MWATSRQMAAQRKRDASASNRVRVAEVAADSTSMSVWAALLLVVSLVAFAPTFGAEFIKWDDQFYVQENPLLQDPAGLRKIWDPIAREAQEYYPILFSSYWLEYRLWGLDPAPYHATTLALHLANVVLVLLLARRLGAAGWVAAGTAALFAVHPVQVASVAWIAEQKNTLSGLFYLVAFLLYLRHRRTGGWGAYAGCLASFVAGLLSKTQIVTFPISLVLAEWLLLRRADVAPRKAAAAVAARVAPMLMLCIPAAMLTIYFDRYPHTPAFPLVARLGIAANAVWFYLHTFLAPVRLSPVYPEWHPALADASWWLPAVGLFLVGVALAAAWRHIPALAQWGILHFFVSLLPVLGLVSFTYETYTMVADHFLYLPCIGGGLALAAGAAQLLARLPPRPMLRRTAAALGALVVVACAAQTYAEATHWRTNLSFWTRVRDRDPNGFLGNFNLGNHYRYRGEWASAVPHYRRAADIRPAVDYPFHWYVEALRNAQGPEAALVACNQRLRRAPGFAPAYVERAVTYEAMGRQSDAARDLALAERLATVQRRP
jgi:tetratricopeptide (TPR) repeat protein